MSEEEQEEYLRKNGWWKLDNHLWFHKDCLYFCCLEMAVRVQQLRDKDE